MIQIAYDNLLMNGFVDLAERTQASRSHPDYLIWRKDCAVIMMERINGKYYVMHAVDAAGNLYDETAFSDGTDGFDKINTLEELINFLFIHHTLHKTPQPSKEEIEGLELEASELYSSFTH